MATKFIQRYDGEGWSIRNREPFFIRCCDCGLVHRMVVVSDKARRGKLFGIAAERDNRRTSYRRKKLKSEASHE